MNCYHCGAKCVPDAKFCPKCGAAMTFTEELLAAGRQNDEKALEALYYLTYNNVYHTLKSMIRDEDTVLDLVQDTYVKAFRSLEQLDKAENFRAWVKRIAANKAKDYIKKAKPMLFSEMSAEEDLEFTFEDDRLEHQPEAVLDRKETARLVNEILDGLSEEQRMVIGMFYYEQMSVREIAEALGCSENTVKSRLNYGRKKVEYQVRQLEKKGVKLYSLAPFAFFLWLLRGWENADPVAPAAMAASASASASAGAMGAAAAAGKGIAAKIVAGVLALALVGRGAAGVVSLVKNDRAEKPPISVSDIQKETTPETTVEATVEATVETVPETTAETMPDPKEVEDALFEIVLGKYRDACDVDSAAWLADPAFYEDQYKTLNARYLRYFHELSQFNFYYARVDLNNDDREELLIGSGWEGDIALIGLYTHDGVNQVANVLPDGGFVFANGTFLAMPVEGEQLLWIIAPDGFNTDLVSFCTGQNPFAVAEQHGGFLEPEWTLFIQDTQ